MIFSRFATLRDSCRRDPPAVALVLGSGLGDLASHFAAQISVTYPDVPGLEAPSVAGHHGRLFLGDWSGRRTLLFGGRLHFYEGHAWRSVIEPVAIAHRLGARSLLLTNAAGGIRDDLVPGNLMALRAHVEWTRGYPWPCEEKSSPYSPRLLGLLQKSAQTCGIPLSTGAYAQVTGPCYETPAEIKALRQCGADAVGMSTTREIAWAASMGMECAALSCITNRAAGLSANAIHHGEVLTCAAAAHEHLTRLIETFLGLL